MKACEKGNEDAIYVLLNAGADPNISNANGYTWLHYAAVGDCSEEVLRTILNHGADVNAASNDNETALMKACHEGNLDVMNVLLNAGANTHISDDDGDNWLHHAACGDCSKEVLQTILDHGADVNTTNENNTTSLMYACHKGSTDVINVLLNAGADHRISNANGYTWLHYASVGDCSKEVLHAILNYGADINAASKNNETALMKACERGNIDVMNVLLNAGANPHISDDDGDNWLHYAAYGDCSKVVLETIIDHGVDVNAVNKYNQTALLIACKKCNEDAINVLLNVGADPTIGDIDGNTCLYEAIGQGCTKEVIEEIINHGADVNVKSKANITPLMKACHKGNMNVINILLNASADPNITDANGCTWLHAAVCWNCRKEALQAIIGHGTDVNAMNKQKQTALALACENGNVDDVKLLLNARADPNIADVNGNTLLHNAVRNTISKETLQAIIDHGADVNAVNNEGATALLLACNIEHRESVNVLMRAGANTSIVDVHGDTCLHKLLHRECDQETLQLLLDHGVPVNAINKSNQTAYMLACDQGNMDAMCALLNAGSDPNITCEDDEDHCYCFCQHIFCLTHIFNRLFRSS